MFVTNFSPLFILFYLFHWLKKGINLFISLLQVYLKSIPFLTVIYHRQCHKFQVNFSLYFWLFEDLMNKIVMSLQWGHSNPLQTQQTVFKHYSTNINSYFASFDSLLLLVFRFYSLYPYWWGRTKYVELFMVIYPFWPTFRPVRHV